ncbi:ferrisiderophore receptor [Litorimonas cladophorae]|uniref:Ferrisiderophore receptor n=1 Tax=Litorimonas cladophorae TaxID=1220491 RepID=A0A918KIC3_9PROT|nr:TonB-dependent siderophore receptor [Litorimonas cladophorae]GGX62260.1 ferrisiderophore receptor [Litorimonas cladophorae]
MNSKCAVLLGTALATTCGLPTSAFAQDTDEDVIVVTGQVSTFGAVKSEIPILETARSVSVITDEDFIDIGALTLDDTLGYTAGVVGDTFGFSTRGDFPRVRGLDVPEYLDNVQVLFGFYNNARSDVYTLEQVEVLKGPASVLYGSGSPGGILNTVSKRASKEALGGEVVFDIGTNDRYQLAGDYGVDLSGDGSITGRLVGVYRDGGTQVDFVNDDAIIFAPSVTFESERSRITALVNYTNRESDTAHQFLPLSVTGCQSGDVSISETNVCANAPTDSVGESLYVGDPNFNTYDTESVSATLFVEHKINESLTFEATARARDNSADYKQTWVAFLGAGNPRVLSNGDAAARSWYDAPASSTQFAIDTRMRAKFETGALQHEVLGGINRQDVSTDQAASYLYALPTTFNLFNPVYDGSEIPTDTIFDAARGATSSDIEFTGFYLNDYISVGDLELTAGIRFDDLKNNDGTTTQNDNAVSLSFGALYKTKFGLNPYVNYAESFEPVIGNDGVTGDALEPQEGEQFEVGLKYKAPDLPIYFTAAYFDIEQSNLANPAGLPNAASQQEGVSNVQGFEFEGRAFLGDFDVRGSFSTLDTEDPNGLKFSSIPETQAAAWVGWNASSGALKGIRLGAGVRYFGGNESEGEAFLAANSFAPTPILVETNGATLVDGLIGYDFEKISLTLNARNLLNENYFGTCLTRGDCFPGESRSVVARAAYRF